MPFIDSQSWQQLVDSSYPIKVHSSMQHSWIILFGHLWEQRAVLASWGWTQSKDSLTYSLTDKIAIIPLIFYFPPPPQKNLNCLYSFFQWHSLSCENSLLKYSFLTTRHHIIHPLNVSFLDLLMLKFPLTEKFMNTVKRPMTNQENIFKMSKLDKVQICKIYKELLKINLKNLIDK